MKLCSSALPQLAQSLLTQFQKVLWACDGGDVDKDTTGVARRAWKLLDVICPILEPAQRHYVASSHTMQNLDMCSKIYSQAKSSKQFYPWKFLRNLRNALHFTFAAAGISRDPGRLWYTRVWRGDSPSPENLDWLVDCLDYIHSHDHETTYDILLLLGNPGVRCSTAKQHKFIKSLVACMGSGKPYNLRHAALRVVHNIRQEMASIHAINDANVRDMVLTELSPAILTAVYPRPDSTPADHGPDGVFDYHRDECYLELVFALARNSNWHSHLFGDHHIDRCISMIREVRFMPHEFYLAGILLRIVPEQLSPTSLNSITDRQWWVMMSSAWRHARIIDDIHYFEFLPDLVEGTKKYMEIASKSDLKDLIRYVDYTLTTLEERDSEQREQGEQGEGVAVAVKEFRTVASDMLDKMIKSDEVISP
ncbi:hypothetical protein DEU56DRAFT_172050 [Suillus clintonianus]|uniref:uncharacterized protein n=1 Tax=Suillus clintonianus TaxID=1904413 RepID=UPI001B8771AD|nr:uncharacterized protein DEU56DRAFT_172050 [Suillus clintonianus]KAG2146359.1 hypothetical protein DEU56DRAFT_172050 [Suillus clintonianus]